MVVPRHPHPVRRHLLREVAADSGQIAVIAVTTTPVGAMGLLQIARLALEPLMPVSLRHRAMVMRQHQGQLLPHQDQLLLAGSAAGGAARIATTIQATGATRISRTARHALGNGARHSWSCFSLALLLVDVGNLRVAMCLRVEPYRPIVEMHIARSFRCMEKSGGVRKK